MYLIKFREEKSLLKFAWEMLHSKRKKLFISVIVIALSVFLILYELTTFHRVMTRVYSVVKEMSDVDIWVMDPEVHSLNTDRFIQSDRSGQGVFDCLRKVRSLPEVEVASPFSTGVVAIRLFGGKILECLLMGVDQSSYLGAPKVMKKGKISNLGHENGIVIDEVSSRTLFSGKQLRIGEYNASIVAIAAARKKMHAYPLIYTTIDRAAEIRGYAAEELPFILVKAKEGAHLSALCKKIEEATNLKAFTRRDFSYLVLSSYLKDHQVPYHFAWVVLFGLILTLGVLAGSIMNAIDQFHKDIQIFKAIGATKNNINMILLVISQVTSGLGWVMGVALYLLFYSVFSSFDLIFSVSFEALLISFGMLFFISGLIAFSKGFFIKEICEEVSW
jgi:putative ABC transport system permease protein